MTNLIVKKASLNGEIIAPSSKSVAHRMIIASAISGAKVQVFGNLNSKDIQATLDCMQVVGARVKAIDGGVDIDATCVVPKGNVFDVNESGSTMRFLLPILPIYLNSFSLKGQGRIGGRPIKSLKDAMAKNGVTVSADYLPVMVSGRYDSCDFTIDATESSQYVTGLLFTLAKLGGGTLKIDGRISSRGYIDITVDVLKEFGIAVEFDASNNAFSVKSGQGFNAPKSLYVNGDWSSACFFIVAGVLNGDVQIKGLKYPDSQPDSIIVDVIKRAGGNVYYEDGVLYAKKSQLQAIDFDADGCPDIVPILAVALSQAEGVSTITGTARLRIKESDRVKAIIDTLSAVGIKCEAGANHIKIYGGTTPKAGVIDSVNDHRIAMSGAVLGSVAEGEVTIKGIECTSKSYPDFINDYLKLGGKVL